MMKLLEKITVFPDYDVLISDSKSVSNKQLVHELEKRERRFPNKPFSILAISVKQPFDAVLDLLAATRLKKVVIPFLDEFDVSLKYATVVCEEGDCWHKEAELESELLTQFLKEDEAGLVLTTSGTTGTPKFVLHRFRLLLEKYLKLRTRLKTVLVFPLHHVSGLETFISVVSAGGTIFFPEDNRPETVLQTIGQHQVDFIACTPSYLKLLLLQPTGAQQLSSLQFINLGGEKTSKADLCNFKLRLPSVKFYQAFGTTETTNLRTYTNHEETFSLGQIGEDYSVRDGELFLRKPDSLVGFLDKPDSLEEWIPTGDKVELLQNGALAFEKRHTTLINVGGEKVNPEEVEEVLKNYAGVMDVHVFAERNNLLGQIVAADIFTSEILSKKAIRSFCREKLPEYKVPFKLYFKNSIETTDRLKRRN